MIDIKRGFSNEEKVEVKHDKMKENGVVEKEYKLEIVWTSVVMNTLLHLVAVYGIFLPKQWKTIAFGL